MIYALPPYGYFPGYDSYEHGVRRDERRGHRSAACAPPPMPETGFLKLDVEPRGVVQVFVDGVYIGTLADLGDEIELAPGVRRIELRAPGYRPLTSTAEIVVRSIDRLSRRAGEASTAPRRALRHSAVPGHPLHLEAAGRCTDSRLLSWATCRRRSMLPAGCDIGKLKTISP